MKLPAAKGLSIGPRKTTSPYFNASILDSEDSLVATGTAVFDQSSRQSGIFWNDYKKNFGDFEIQAAYLVDGQGRRYHFSTMERHPSLNLHTFSCVPVENKAEAVL